MSVRRLCFFAVSVCAITACASEPESGTAVQESRETGGTWRREEIARRPNHDFGSFENVSLAIDRRGGRHLAFIGDDGFVHYRGPSGADRIIDVGSPVAGVGLALGLHDEAHVAFTVNPSLVSGGEIFHAVLDGDVRITPTGQGGTVDAIVVDANGVVHIASDNAAPPPVDWRATVATERPDGGFDVTDLPRPIAGGWSFRPLGLTVDASGNESTLLSVYEPRDESFPISLKAHTYFAHRSAGGAFTLESMNVVSADAALALDASGTLHAVLVPFVAPGSTAPAQMPVYVQRGPGDAEWSSPQPIAVTTARLPSLAVDARGTVRVAFATDDSVELASRAPSQEWKRDVAAPVPGNLPSLTLDPNGKPVVAYRFGASYWLSSEL